jgi:hypothetical protein
MYVYICSYFRLEILASFYIDVMANCVLTSAKVLLYKILAKC